MIQGARNSHKRRTDPPGSGHRMLCQQATVVVRQADGLQELKLSERWCLEQLRNRLQALYQSELDPREVVARPQRRQSLNPWEPVETQAPQARKTL